MAAQPRRQRLIDIYEGYFQSVTVEDEETLRQALELRYQVYCVENRFEDPAFHPDGLERDEYDAQSIHSILIHRASGLTAGTVRLIMPSYNGSSLPTPIFDICKDPVLHDPRIVPVEHACEISRFAISKAMRRRSEDRGQPYGAVNIPSATDPRRMIPHLCLGLMTSMMRMGIGRGLRHVTAVMEPALLRMLAGLGIHFFTLGPTVEYHGVRQPCHSDVDILLTRVWLQRPEVWEVLTQDGALWPLNEKLAAALRTKDDDPAERARRALEIQLDMPAAACA